MNQKVRQANLNEAWQRLETVCAKLWDSNSPCAVEAQAVVEEFKGEVHRLDACLANTEERRALDLREHDDDLAALRGQYEIELASLKKRMELMEHALREKEAHAESLLKTLAQKEEENLDFHAQVLRMSASSDETKTKKMEEFYQELMKTETAQADSWQQRHVALEQENDHRQKLIAARQGELDAWEKRVLEQESSVKKRTTEVDLRAQQLAQEYRKKQQEIDDLKASLQRSITDLVRQYQSRLRGADPEPTPHPR